MPSGHEYLKRDYRFKCRKCRRWMQRAPRDPEATPAVRGPDPNSAICTDCTERFGPMLAVAPPRREF